MLKAIGLKNFKLHEDTSIEAAPITVFIGPNNSGKSSIFQALLLLRQAAARNDQFLCQPPTGIQPVPSEYFLYSPNLIIDVGAFDEVVRKGSNDIDVQLCGDIKTHIHIVDEVSADLAVRIRGNRLVFNSGSISCFDSHARWEFIDGHPIKANPVALSLGGVQYKIQITDTFSLTQPAGYEFGRPVQPEEALTLNETSRWLGAIPSKLLGSVHPVYALRGFEEWGYPITDYPPSSLELMTLHDRAVALPNALASDLQLKKQLSDRLEQLLHTSIDYVHVPGKRLKILARSSVNNARETLFVNEGAGANQLPFIFVPVLLTPPNETVLLSEPEAHLHPKGQCELMRMLLVVAKKENIQFFIETHSEHVLHVILNAIGKGEWEPSQVAIYSFENVNGTAKVDRLEVDEQGGVKGGLPGFFDQSLDELTEYLETLKKPTA
jgi:energy-coupling factor transporter ATP-binding protein EcfA2